MSPKRAPLALVLSAVLFLTSGFAATKKFHRHDRSRDWNDSSLQNGDLLNAGSSVPSEGGSPALSNGTLESSSLALSPGTPDNWNGGTGFWNDPNNWDHQVVPGASSDVTICSNGSKGNDLVTLNTGSTNINSLTLGGASDGFSSELTDGGVKQTLNITNNLIIGQTGYLYLYGGSTINTSDTTNAGTIQLLNGSTLAITGNLINTNTGALGLFSSVLTVTGDVDNSGGLGIGLGFPVSTITVGGMLTNEAAGLFALSGFGDLATLGSLKNAGLVDVEGGDKLKINGAVDNSGTFNVQFGSSATIGNGLTNSGLVNLENAGMLAITGDVTNSGVMGTDLDKIGGGNTLSIGGNLTNNWAFGLLGAGDVGTISGDATNNVNGQILVANGAMGTIGGTLTNSGQVDVENGGTLQINGNVSNPGQMFTDNLGLGGGNTLKVTGNLNNGGLFNMYGFGDVATIGGTLTNSGQVDVETASTLTIHGNVSNPGQMYTDFLGLGGGNTIAIDGMLTNGADGTFILNGPGDMATIGSLTNSGYVDVEGGSTLTIKGDVTNPAAGLGQSGIFTSYNGTGGNKLNIGGTLTNSGTFQLNGPGDTATIGKGVLNDFGGYIDVEGGSTLNITGDVINNGSMTTTNSLVGGGNNMSITGNLTNNNGLSFLGLGDKGSISGDVTNNGEFLVFFGAKGTVGGNLTNSGLAELGFGGTLTISGNVDNSGNLSTGGATLNVKGSLTNESRGNFILSGPGDTVTIGSVSNSGYVDVENGSTLTINGAVDNSGFLDTSYDLTGSATVNITGALTNEVNGTFALFRAHDTATLGGLNNSGRVDLENGSSLTINGAADNFGILSTDFYGYGGGNTITSNGLLTNEATGQFILNGPGDMATIGGNLTNAAGAKVDIEGGSTLHIGGDADNSGTLVTGTNGSGGNTVTVTGNLTNEAGGIFQLNAPGDMAGIGGDMTNSGSVDVESQTTLTVAGNYNQQNQWAATTLNGTLTLMAGQASFNAGTFLFGNGGTIVGNALMGGVIVPGTSLLTPGALNITGNYTQAGSGMFALGIAGTAQCTGYSCLNITGSALLGGSLNIALLNGFFPKIGDTFTFLTANGGVGGTFSTPTDDCPPGTDAAACIYLGGSSLDEANRQFYLIYGENYVELETEAVVPEPATLLVLIPGLLGMGYGLRRKLLA